jgi:hypothetical protein
MNMGGKWRKELAISILEMQNELDGQSIVCQELESILPASVAG